MQEVGVGEGAAAPYSDEVKPGVALHFCGLSIKCNNYTADWSVC